MAFFNIFDSAGFFLNLTYPNLFFLSFKTWIFFIKPENRPDFKLPFNTESKIYIFKNNLFTCSLLLIELFKSCKMFL